MNKLSTLYESLYQHYGELHWWPANTPYEVMLGAILTQNTAWVNVEKALANLGEIPPRGVQEMELKELEMLIRPAGFATRKAQTIKAITQWFLDYKDDPESSLEDTRQELLSMRGIGPETADAILLYAFNQPSFVVDAYTMRLFKRYPIQAGSTYMQVKHYCEQELPRDTKVYNHFHALVVEHGKRHCKKKPLCLGCPLGDTCERDV